MEYKAQVAIEVRKVLNKILTRELDLMGLKREASSPWMLTFTLRSFKIGPFPMENLLAVYVHMKSFIDEITSMVSQILPSPWNEKLVLHF